MQLSTTNKVAYYVARFQNPLWPMFTKISAKSSQNWQKPMPKIANPEN